MSGAHSLDHCSLAVEASAHSSPVQCSDKTIEAAEALLHMDSPSSLKGDRSPGESTTPSRLLPPPCWRLWESFGQGACASLHVTDVFVPPYVNTPELIHAAMRPDVMTETEVEVSTEEAEPMELCTVLEAPLGEPIRKKKGTSAFESRL